METEAPLTVGSLFSGIGGIELGLERAGGFETVWQVEKDDFRRSVLHHHWSNTIQEGPRVQDIDHGKWLEPVDVLTGGPPCKPTSQAAARTDRDNGWLWSEMHRILTELQEKPSYVILENPQSLRYKERGLGIVLRDLSRAGYDAEWQVLRASDFGAPHRRARIWVVAYPNGDSESELSVHDEAPILSEPSEADR